MDDGLRRVARQCGGDAKVIEPTPEQRVREAWPVAYQIFSPIRCAWLIIGSGWTEEVGSGPTPEAAWADAAGRLGGGG